MKLKNLNNIVWLGGHVRQGGWHAKVALKVSALRSGLRGGGLRFASDSSVYEAIFKDLNSSPAHTLQYYVEELVGNAELSQKWQWAVAQYKLDKYRDWEERVRSRPGNVALYYALIRERRPDVIVETGTATGSMTSFLLAALERNNKGKLISIDIPPKQGQLTMDITLPASQIGYWIPESFRSRWDYRIGDAKLLLPKVMTEEKVDVFVHDSLHTRTHMLFEYSVARCLMPAGGLIISDDILWNNVFDDFLALNSLRGYAPLSNPNIGCFINSFDEFEHGIGTDVVNFDIEDAAAR